LAKDHGLSRKIGLTAYNFSSMLHLVVGTDLIATSHARLAHLLQGMLPIEVRPVPMPMKTLQQAMQWHKYRSRDPGLIWLRDLLKEAAAQMDGAPTPPAKL
jgi:DNA-binding transcriptional LysR family regulator